MYGGERGTQLELFSQIKYVRYTKIRMTPEQYKEKLYNNMCAITAQDIVLYSEKTLIMDNEKYVIAVYPNKDVLTRLKTIQTSLLTIDASLLSVPQNQLHITIFSFETSSYEDSMVTKLINSIKSRKLSFMLGGLFYNTHSFFVPCIPLNFSLRELRKELRSLFKITGTDYSKYNRLYEEIGWFNIARCSKNPSELLLNMVKEQSKLDLGELQYEQISMLRTTSKVLDPNVTITVFKS